MQQKRHSADQIISNLRQVDVELGKGKKFLKVSNKSEITEQTYERWQMDYNYHRPHRALDYRTPAAFAADCVLPSFATLNPSEHSLVFEIDSLTQPGTKAGGCHH